MRKLITPVQYESALDELNALRPLQLRDESKILVPYPVLCKDSDTRSVIGMLARCSPQGALLRHTDKDYSAWQPIMGNFSYFVSNIAITFAQRVSRVIAISYGGGDCDDCRWTNSDYTHYIKQISIVQYAATILPFRGTVIYARGDFSIPTGWMNIGFYGLY